MLKSITITGADDEVNPNDLLRLSNKYPFVTKEEFNDTDLTFIGVLTLKPR